mmetsp:Transcript_28425/g.69193  ORF Transcript_28425/g.69193 Transcript_28425/m.69193 type:complete len:642 (-) Transcript_28425:48-1973(-)
MIISPARLLLLKICCCTWPAAVVVLVSGFGVRTTTTSLLCHPLHPHQRPFRVFFSSISTSRTRMIPTASSSSASPAAHTQTEMTDLNPKFPWCVLADVVDDVDPSTKSQETQLPQSPGKSRKTVSLFPITTASVNDINAQHTSSSYQPFALVSPFRDVMTVSRSSSSSSPNEEQRLDMTQISDWMEVIEQDENRSNDEGGAGAYDSFRCDLLLNTTTTRTAATTTSAATTTTTITRQHVWGEDYHLQRLQASYRSLCDKPGPSTTSSLDSSSNNFSTQLDSMIDVATKESKVIIDRLLSAAATAPSLTDVSTTPKNQGDTDVRIQLLRLSILWSPPKDENSSKIVVRGHVCCSAKPVPIHSSPEPIVVSIAVHKTHRHHHHDHSDNATGDKITPDSNSNSNNENFQVPSSVVPANTRQMSPSPTIDLDVTLPSRFDDNPHSKIASWCRERKKMEDPHTYKPKDASEVLMVRPRKDSEGRTRMELLEGLSSNLFVVYKDGSLRTATDGVLHGYVRHLVLECCTKSGIQIDPRPIYLDEVHEWKEAFITSSSRLIFPISKILIPDDATIDDDDQSSKKNSGDKNDNNGPSTFTDYWVDEILVQNQNNNNLNNNNKIDPSSSSPPPSRPLWWKILNEILTDAGY